MDAEKATKETEEEEKKEEDVHTKEKEREKENEKEEAEEEEEDGGGDLPPPPPTFLAEQAAEVEEQAKEEQTPGGKDDLDPDYQELEDGSEPTSPQNTGNKRAMGLLLIKSHLIFLKWDWRSRFRLHSLIRQFISNKQKQKS